MRFLESWVSTPLAQALGWTLLHSFWEGAIIAAVLGAALWATRSARARYAAACAAMLLMLGGIGCTLIRVMPERAHGWPGVSTIALPPWNVPTDLGAAGYSGIRLAVLVPWLVPFWIAGVWIFALGQVAGWIWLSRLRRRGVCCPPEHWRQVIERLSERLRVSKPVRILESCLAEVPMVVGHIRPVILVPIGLLAGLPPGQVEAILLHELAHIRRHDYLVNVLERAAECLLFYHPAVWWISRVIRAERENCCDDVVVATSGDARQYAVALTTLAEMRWSGGNPAIAATGGTLVKRIRRLLYPKAASGAWAPLIAVAIVITTAVVTLAAWPLKPAQQPAVAPQAEAEPAETSPYDRWLDQEVPYIITNQERAAFKELATDEERNMFITQFWERRNPHPGSPENEFKEQHHRRIAYANQHFASNSAPGWKTDRGRIYIVYGPPDEIDDHPSGSIYRAPMSESGKVVLHPFQVWRYAHFRFPQGVGSLTLRFVDESSSGDYHMTMDLGGGASESPSGHVAFKSAQQHAGDVGDNATLTRQEAQLLMDGGSVVVRGKSGAEASPYDRWLNEEVVYIISKEERAAFLKSHTDDERYKFVEQFWERRNPNPGSPENKFKEEHYRRTAYANEHWATDKPGWMSDRGRIYIVFGPPDEIDSRPDGWPCSTEVWRYKHMAGLGDNVILTFADPGRNGSYGLVSSSPVMKGPTSH